VPSIVAFLQANGPARQFFPCYIEGDFLGAHGALKGLRLDDLLLAYRGDRLVGTLGAWDQSGFRQAVVEGYRGLLRWARPLYNGWALVRGRPALPETGAVLRNRFAAIPIVEGADADVLEALIRAARSGVADYLLLGLHERDPLLRVARRHAAAEYRTHLFIACWEDGEAYRRALDGRVPYLELGSL
jgi:hypothetical protein